MKIARRKFKVDVPSMAMGDIAFNLLIFFVILARATDDSHVKWTPSSTPHVDPAKQARARVAVDEDNKLYLNGRETDVLRLGSSLEQILGNAPAGERVVVLKIHNETQAGRFEKILEVVSEAGGEIVHILKENKEQ